MSIENLRSILEKKAAEQAAQDAFEPQKEIEGYKLKTGELYTKVEQSIQELVQSNLCSIKKENITLNEESLGAYNIDSLVISFSNEKVVLEPVGTMLIGSKGRVDMKGPRGIEKFLLIRKGVSSPSQLISVGVSVGDAKIEQNNGAPVQDIVWEWKMLPNSSNWTNFEPVNEQTITSALMRVING
ncbi:hypothetical protein ACET64_17495 [Aeromonas veronii]